MLKAKQEGQGHLQGEVEHREDVRVLRAEGDDTGHLQGVLVRLS